MTLIRHFILNRKHLKKITMPFLELKKAKGIIGLIVEMINIIIHILVKKIPKALMVLIKKKEKILIQMERSILIINTNN